MVSICYEIAPYCSRRPRRTPPWSNLGCTPRPQATTITSRPTTSLPPRRAYMLTTLLPFAPPPLSSHHPHPPHARTRRPSPLSPSRSWSPGALAGSSPLPPASSIPFIKSARHHRHHRGELPLWSRWLAAAHHQVEWHLVSTSHGRRDVARRYASALSLGTLARRTLRCASPTHSAAIAPR